MHWALDVGQLPLQRPRCERLHQDLMHADVQRGGDAGHRTDLGHHDDRQIRLWKIIGRSDDPDDFEAVQSWQMPVDEHNVRPDPADGVQRLDAVAGFVDQPGARVQQHRSREPAQICVAIHQQDGCLPNRTLERH